MGERTFSSQLHLDFCRRVLVNVMKHANVDRSSRLQGMGFRNQLAEAAVCGQKELLTGEVRQAFITYELKLRCFRSIGVANSVG